MLALYLSPTRAKIAQRNCTFCLTGVLAHDLEYKYQFPYYLFVKFTYIYELFIAHTLMSYLCVCCCMAVFEFFWARSTHRLVDSHTFVLSWSTNKAAQRALPLLDACSTSLFSQHQRGNTQMPSFHLTLLLDNRTFWCRMLPISSTRFKWQFSRLLKSKRSTRT